MSIAKYVEAEAVYNHALALGRSQGEAVELVHCYNYNRQPLTETVLMVGSMVQYQALHMIPYTGIVKAKSIAESVLDGLKRGKSLTDYESLEIRIFEEYQTAEPDKAELSALGVQASIAHISNAWANNNRFKLVGLLDDGWDTLVAVMSGQLTYPAFTSKLEPYIEDVWDAVQSPLNFSMDGLKTAGQRLMEDFKNPAWQIPLFAMADVMRFGAYFQAATDPANMDRRLVGMSQHGQEWKGKARADRTDYLMYLDRIIKGRSKPRSRYCQPPTIESLADRDFEVYQMVDFEDEEA